MWLYIPKGCLSSPSAQASEDSNSELNLHVLQAESLPASKGNVMSQRSLSNAWKKKHWMKRLFGLTLEPSTASLGVEKWIASLPDTLALPSPASEVKKGSTTPDG